MKEPGPDAQKFPNPQVYFYQARGFNLAESYYQSINAPYLGLIVGEPLASPFARSGHGQWGGDISNAVLSGTAMLSASFSAADASRPLQQVDLFVDGKYFSTLTNLSPRPGNLLKIALNGYPITYPVPASATLGTVANGLAAMINLPTNSNSTRIKALVQGDRIELRSMAANEQSVAFYVLDTLSANSTGTTYRVTSLPASFPPRMIPCSPDGSGVFRMQVEIPSALHYVIQSSTNLVTWLPIYTNTVPGLLDFQDADAVKYSMRFYRVVGPIPDQPPKLFAPGIGVAGAFQMQVESLPGQPCAVLASTNLIDWSPVLTNQTGGQVTFVDPDATTYAGRFYQALLVPSPPPAFAVTNGPVGATLVRIDNASFPYRVEVSTNVGQWTALVTNFAIGKIQTDAVSVVGNADTLSTFLSGSRSTFLTSEASGYQQYTVKNGSFAIGGYLKFTFTKTNGAYVTVGVTNLSGGAVSSTNLAGQLVDSINATPALQGSDGIVAEDFAVVIDATFTLRARSPGYQAAFFKAFPKSSEPFSPILQGSSNPLNTLTGNLSDLQSRNHLYVTAGSSRLALSFPLDTTTLADGHHELIAVAYEGSHVRTQTHSATSVVVQNTALQAQLVMPSSATLVVTNGFNVTVNFNTDSVSLVHLFSTGGLLAGATNQSKSSVSFAVNGQTLGVGEHPFYAIVTTTNGLRYRTETRKLTLVGP